MSKQRKILKRSSLVLLFVLAAIILTGCATTPFTNRSQLMLTSENSEMEMGTEAWQELWTKEKENKEARYVTPLTRTASAIVKAADKPEYKWEFRVIQNDGVANAFCLPGGKIAVYTGLYPYAANEAELATVIAHEVAHALARHSGEQISRDAMLSLGAVLISPFDKSNAIGTIYGIVGETGVRLPFSRSNELEADYIGLLLMAKAGFDPTAGISFWQKFGAGGTDSTIGEWLSTHPNSSKRIEQMKELLPEAVKAYNQAPVKYGLGNPINIKK